MNHVSKLDENCQFKLDFELEVENTLQLTPTFSGMITGIIQWIYLSFYLGYKNHKLQRIFQLREQKFRSLWIIFVLYNESLQEHTLYACPDLL